MQTSALAEIGTGIDLGALIHTLCAQSRSGYAQPFAFDSWPRWVDRRQWFTSETLVSLNGTKAWDGLDQEQRQLVSFWDAVAFFSINIHGEGQLMQGIASRLHTPAHQTVSPYLHHMLDEENKHSASFAEFCLRYGGKIYPNRVLSLGADPEEAADFLFFARVMIFEDIVDCFNRAMALDAVLEPTARWINAQHHLEERRHLAFGRNLVRRLWAIERDRWSDAVLDEVRAALTAYLQTVWRSLYNPQVYVDAGLDNAWQLVAEAYATPHARAQRERMSRRCRNFLARSRILTEPVSA
jgi:hypothetical protein